MPYAILDSCIAAQQGAPVDAVNCAAEAKRSNVCFFNFSMFLKDRFWPEPEVQ